MDWQNHVEQARIALKNQDRSAFEETIYTLLRWMSEALRIHEQKQEAGESR